LIILLKQYCKTAGTGSDLAWVTSVMQKRMQAAGIHPEMDSLEKSCRKKRTMLIGHSFEI
jgi:hypothetical protein